jgi:hypothetical protein
MPRPITLFLSLALGAIAAVVLVSCGSDDDTGGIPPEAADGMLNELEAARAAQDEGDCDEVAESSEQIRVAAEALPDTVDAELRAAIVEGSANLGELANTQCEPTTTTEEEPETTETEPTTTAAEPTTTTTEETTTTTEPEEPEEGEGDDDGGNGEPTGPPSDTGPPTETGPGTGGTGDGRDAKREKEKSTKDKKD